jgi:hypothetical protein
MRENGAERKCGAAAIAAACAALAFLNPGFGTLRPTPIGRRSDGAGATGIARPAPERDKMNHMLFALSLGFGGVILAAHPAFAAPHCAPRAVVVAQLAERYDEARRGAGMAGTAALIELFVSESASWTITVTTPDGRSCLLASGQGWEALSDALPAKGDPA